MPPSKTQASHIAPYNRSAQEDITFFAVCDMFPEFGEDGVAPCFVDCSDWGDGFGCEFEDDDFSSEFEASVHFGEFCCQIRCVPRLMRSFMRL